MDVLKIVQDSPPSTDLSQVKRILAVAAGKGGVGKSSVSVNLALSLKRQGFKVGLLDADVYGPSLQQMLPKGVEPVEDQQNPEKLLPALTFGIPFISVAHFKKAASIVRAPIANQIIEQFLHTVDWGELDYLIIDFPPGTGDIQLTLMQKARIDAAIVVTTPQAVAALDVRKAMQLFEKMEIPILGVVENMSYFLDPVSKQRFAPFGSGAGEGLSKEFSVPCLGEIPIDSSISQAGDLGESLFETAPKSDAADVFLSICSRVIEQVDLLPRPNMNLRQAGPHHLEIELDNQWHRLSLHTLQKRCPCARCKGEKKCAEDVSLLEFSLVGRYAIRVIFSSGCSQGIYPLALIEALVGL